MPIALDPTTAVCGISCRDRPAISAHDVDHRALRLEAVGDAGQQQEGRDQGERELAVEAVDAGRNSTVLEVMTR